MLRSLRKVLVRRLPRISRICGFTRLCYLLNKGRKRIISYHNVIPDHLYDGSVHLWVSHLESSFKTHLEIIRRRFTINCDLKDPNSVTLTFDDGYLNQYSIAYRYLHTLGVNAYFFIPSSFVNTAKMLAVDAAMMWFSYAAPGTYNIDVNGCHLCFTLTKEQFGRQLAWDFVAVRLEHGEIDVNDLKQVLDNTCSLENISEAMNPELFTIRFGSIKPEELQEMISSGSYIGAHSDNHSNMSALSVAALESDVATCASLRGSVYNTGVFCYPYGRPNEVSSIVMDAVKNNGFEWGLSNINYPLDDRSPYSPFFMPRMGLPDTTDVDEIEYILSGAKYLLVYRKLLPLI